MLTSSESLQCACGRTNVVTAARTANATRFPELRDQVIARQLNHFVCESCGRLLIADVDLFYFDFHRKEFIGVFPFGRRAHPDECEPIIAATFERTMETDAPPFLKTYAEGFFTRTCFGLEELREKLVIHEAGLDDFLVEVLKAELLLSHPGLLERGVVTVRLDSFLDDGSLVLVPEAHDGSLAGDPPVNLGARRDAYDALIPLRERLAAERPEFYSGSHVSFRRLVDAI